jgi:uncharacterized protein (TIGR02147 family)
MTIFEFSDYKAFLREFLNQLPKKGRGEINRMATSLDVHPTLVSQVLNGDRDFSIEQIHRLGGYLGLQSLEADYFILLLNRARAGTHELKKYYQQKLEEIKKQSLDISKRLDKHRRLTDTEKALFYSSWIYLAVWLYTSVEDGQTLESVAQRLSLSRAGASEILHFLKTTQLCTEENGIYKMGTQHVHLEFGSPFLSQHHTNWRLQSLQRIENLNEEEMMFTSPISISRKDFQKIREELVGIIKKTSGIIRDSPAEEIACLNIDLFWLRPRD